jgi:ABC-type proline/glycine betaine transport system permease subunit
MKPFTTIAIVVFAFVSLLQLIRFVEAWPLSINGIAIPVWASAIACVLAAVLSIMVWRENRR